MSQFCLRCQRTLELPGQVAFCPYCGQPLSATDADPERTTAPTTPSAPASDSVPETLGDYRLLRRIGQGGMGVVYEGEHTPTNRRVAVKLVDVEASDDAIERFRQEGKLASAVSHPRCVFVYAADQDAGRPFIVLELMPGRTLDDEVRERGPLPVEVALGHALDLIEGLEQVHAIGVIHRDVKPSNCFLDHEGRVKVGDFGLARSLHPDARLTRTGTFVGTPLYASPEQIKGQPLDPRADVYSVCATLFFLLTGRAPHDGGERDALAIMARVVSEDAPSVRSLRPDLPPGLDRILTRGLSRDRERRQPDLAALRADLALFRGTMPGGRLVGARFAAAFTDTLLLCSVSFLVTWQRGFDPSMPAVDFVGAALTLLLMLIYYSVPEGLWGCAVGKALFGLRVRRRDDVAPPGLLRGTARTLLWIGLTSLPGLLAGALFPNKPEYLSLIGLTQSALSLGGIGLAVCTMQKSNGYSCLHDLLSGTQVVPLSQCEGAARFPSRSSQTGTLTPAAEAERIGPYRVLGEAWRHGDESVLRAIDPSLDRPVWLWLRPAVRPELSTARREAHHGARPRWLAHGEHEGQRWDAFLVPTGAPLVEAVATVSKRKWEHARPILVELAAELRREGDVAESYHVSQVWLSPEGRVVLIDVPLASGVAPTREELLAQAALVLLEGKPPSPARTRPPRAVVPTHVRQILLGLPRFGGTLDAAAFHERLVATLDRPTQTSRPGRLLHLGIQLMVQLVCFAFYLPVLMFGMGFTMGLEFTVQEARPNLDQHNLECAVLAAPIVAPTLNPQERLLPALILHHYERPKERDKLAAALGQAEPANEARLARLSPPTQQVIKQSKPPGPIVPIAPPQKSIGDWLKSWGARRLGVFRVDYYGMRSETRLANQASRLEQQPRSGREYLWVAFSFLFVPVGVCLLAALITRRGVRSMILGIDVVRRDGAPAGRLRCAWRVLVAWLPVVGILMLASWLEEVYWDRWTPSGGEAWLLALANVAWLGVIGVPLLLLALTLWTPARALHDRLSGTWLVPR